MVASRWLKFIFQADNGTRDNSKGWKEKKWFNVFNPPLFDLTPQSHDTNVKQNNGVQWGFFLM